MACFPLARTAAYVRRASHFVAVLLALVALSWGSIAAAEPSAADRATARTLAQQGYEALKNKDYATAADRFTRADALVHAPTLLLDLARAQVGLGRLVDAYENYNRIVREGVASNAPPSWQRALADANSEVLTLQPRLPWMTLTVSGPSEPEVLMDGARIPPASLGVKRPIDPGSHTIKASAPGFLSASKTISIQEGQSIEVDLELEEAPPEPVAAPPAATEEAPAKPAGGWRKPAKLVAFGVGGAGLVLGGITGAIAIKKHSELEDACEGGVCGRSQENLLDSYHRYGLASTIGFIVAGAGGAVGTVLWLTEPKQEATAKPRVRPYVGLGGAGLGGTF